MKGQLPMACLGIALAIIIVSEVASFSHIASGMSEGLDKRLAGNATGIYFPLYDLHELPAIISAKEQFPTIPFNVNINPESGPGSAPSSDWSVAISKLKGSGAVVTGYVPTGYGTKRSIADVERMISAYSQYYPGMLDGIMFDEVSGSCSEFSFYKEVAGYARSLGYSYLRANVGGPVCQKEVPLFDQIAIYEGSGYPSQSILESRTFDAIYPKDVVGFGATIHTEPGYDPSWLFMAQKYLKWVYITDQAEPNPYSVMPSYIDRYLVDLSVPPTNLQPSPEFGPLTALVLMISVISIILLTTKHCLHSRQ